MTPAFDAFADIYEAWCASVAVVTDANKAFYVEEYEGAEGPVVELGIGDGRIAVEAARRGVDVIGVDSSPAMLERCRRRFAEAGVSERLTLVEADFESFELPGPVGLALMPFHTIGALRGLNALGDFLERVRRQLVPGGRFVFDHFQFSEEIARARGGLPTLRSELRDDEGRDTLLWVASNYDFAARDIRIVAWTDHLEADGRLAERRYRRVNLGWVDPEDVRRLAGASGFEIESLWGDFERGPFDASSSHQVWSLRRR